MARRTVRSWSVDTTATPEAAFTYVTDVTKHGEWSPKPFRVDPAPTTPLAVGSTFTSHGHIPGDKDHVNQVVVEAIDPPRTFTFASTERGEQFVHRFDFAPTEAGCRITRTVDSPEPGGAMRLIFPVIFALVIKPDVEKGMRNLKAQLERNGNAPR